MRIRVIELYDSLIKTAINMRFSAQMLGGTAGNVGNLEGLMSCQCVVAIGQSAEACDERCRCQFLHLAL